MDVCGEMQKGWMQWAWWDAEGMELGDMGVVGCRRDGRSGHVCGGMQKGRTQAHVHGGVQKRRWTQWMCVVGRRRDGTQVQMHGGMQKRRWMEWTCAWWDAEETDAGTCLWWDAEGMELRHMGVVGCRRGGGHRDMGMVSCRRDGHRDMGMVGWWDAEEEMDAVDVCVVGCRRDGTEAHGCGGMQKRRWIHWTCLWWDAEEMDTGT